MSVQQSTVTLRCDARSCSKTFVADGSAVVARRLAHTSAGWAMRKSRHGRSFDYCVDHAHFARDELPDGQVQDALF